MFLPLKGEAQKIAYFSGGFTVTYKRKCLQNETRYR